MKSPLNHHSSMDLRWVNGIPGLNRPGGSSGPGFVFEGTYRAFAELVGAVAGNAAGEDGICMYIYIHISYIIYNHNIYIILYIYWYVSWIECIVYAFLFCVVYMYVLIVSLAVVFVVWGNIIAIRCMYYGSNMTKIWSTSWTMHPHGWEVESFSFFMFFLSKSL